MSPILLSVMAALALVPPGSARAGGPAIVGHRGASHDAPENTMASFRLGWEQKADAVELDIRLSQDGKIVVCHDATTKRTAGCDKPVAGQTLAELRALDAGAWKGERWKGEKLPELAEVVAAIPGKQGLFIEIKCGPEVMPELEKVLGAVPAQAAKCTLIGFDFATMRLAKQRFPKQPVLWVISPAADKQTGVFPPLEPFIAKAKEAGLDGIDLDARYPLDEAVVGKVRAAGLQLHAWTVDDAALARKLAGLGLDSITTNRPGWLREQLAKAK